MQVGDEVRTATGAWIEIASVARRRQAATVYNFTVAEFHTYYVGRTGTLVHNNNCTDLAREIRSQIGGGKIMRIEPNLPGAQWIDAPKNGFPKGVDSWGLHDVLVHDGMVYDPLRTGPNPVPFQEWFTDWKGTFNRYRRYE